MNSRDQEILRRYKAGENGYDIARDYGLSGGRVYQIVRPHTLAKKRLLRRGITPKGCKKSLETRLKNGERRAKDETARFLPLIQEGLSFGEIAARLGWTRNAVAGKFYRLGLKTKNSRFA